MAKERLFIAANISDEQRANVARLVEDLQKGARFTKAHPKWARVPGMHLTVRFLGNIEEAKKQEIIETLGPTIASCQAFDLSLAKLGVFPDERNPRVLWLGVDKGKARLVTLAQTVQASLTPLGSAPEKRPYHPHLTLARIKSMRGVKALMDLVHSHRAVRCGKTRIGHLSLYQSELHPDGARYTELHRWPLAGADEDSAYASR
ncbi:MAG: RNA 2',3'-cyclic phosphodiesterase [Candidatus Sumerlaeota bacterium]